MKSLAKTAVQKLSYSAARQHTGSTHGFQIKHCAINFTITPSLFQGTVDYY